MAKTITTAMNKNIKIGLLKKRLKIIHITSFMTYLKEKSPTLFCLRK